jgi:hypothetical protein
MALAIALEYTAGILHVNFQICLKTVKLDGNFNTPSQESLSISSSRRNVKGSLKFFFYVHIHIYIKYVRIYVYIYII